MAFSLEGITVRLAVERVFGLRGMRTDWQIYRVVFAKPVSQDLVFEVSLLDEETPPSQKAELLYLLSCEAQRAAELDAYYEKKAALSGANIAKALLGEKMLNALRLEMRRAFGHNLAPQELATLLVAEVFRPDVAGDETARLVLRAAAQNRRAASGTRAADRAGAPTSEEHFAKASAQLRPIVDDLFAYAAKVGPDVGINPLRNCIAFRTRRNFCCFEVRKNHLLIALELDPAGAASCDFARDVSKVGHQGTGDLQLRIERPEQIEQAKELMAAAYERSLRSAPVG